MAKGSPYADLAERSWSALRLGLAAYLFGVLGLYAVGCFTGMNARYGRSVTDFSDDMWPVTHCLYQAGITFTTVGFTDELGTDRVRVLRDRRTGAHYAENSHDGIAPAPGAPPVEEADLELEADFSVLTILTTVFTALGGMAVFIYAIGAVTAFFVEGAYREMRERKRSARVASRMTDHFIVCGTGPTARHAVDRLSQEGASFIVISDDDDGIGMVREAHPALHVLRADPSEIDSLHHAGIDHAAGLLAALDDDIENLVLLITVRQMKPGLRVLCSSQQPQHAARLVRLGAQEAHVPPAVGGMRLASEAIRPTVVEMLDRFLGHEDDPSVVRFTGIRIGPGCPMVGKSLGDCGLFRSTGVRVLAVRKGSETRFRYNPPPSTTMDDGDTLAVLADEEGLARVREVLGTPDDTTGFRRPEARP